MVLEQTKGAIFQHIEAVRKGMQFSQVTREDMFSSGLTLLPSHKELGSLHQSLPKTSLL